MEIQNEGGLPATTLQIAGARWHQQGHGTRGEGRYSAMGPLAQVIDREEAIWSRVVAQVRDFVHAGSKVVEIASFERRAGVVLRHAVE